MPTLVACLRRSVEAIQPHRVPTRFSPATRLRRRKSQRDQGPLATSQARMCPRTANSGLTDAELQEIVLSHNLTPRKCLGFLTPLQALLKELGRDVQIRFA